MANEATLLIQTALPIKMTVADGTGIEKGTLLALADPNTASANTTYNGVVGGILGAEKIADDGVTQSPVFREGVWKVLLSGACTAGDSLILSSAANTVTACPIVSTLSGANIFGTALETGAAGETIKAELRPFRQRFDS